MLVQAVAHLRVGGGICRDILQHNMAGWDIVSILWTIFQADRQVYIRSLLDQAEAKNFHVVFRCVVRRVYQGGRQAESLQIQLN
jgi:hypothetical protein